MLLCQHCQKECKNDNSHRNHVRCCFKNPNRNYKNGMLGKKGSNQYTFAKENNLLVPSPWNKGMKGIKGTLHTEESKRKISLKMTTNNKGGRSKWYEVAGQKVQGTWERNIALKFEEMGIHWKKLTTNKDTFEYDMNGKTKHYTPDFYLKDYDKYLEVKGYWWGNDREKMDIVMKKYPEKKIVIIEKEEYNKILQGELVW